MGEWQPIETAPKGETWILVCDGSPYQYAVIAWHDEDDVISTAGWYMSDGHNDPIWYRSWPYMTHWMPLPAPPEDK